MALPVVVPSARRWAPPALAVAAPPGDRDAARRAALALVLAAAGVVPVTLVAASTFGVGLRGAALHVGAPAAAVVALAAALHRPAAAQVGRAVAAGVVATALYDLSRLAFLLTGVVERDPIPHIGVELGLDPPLVFGYLWRYLGNGTGLALAFLALGLRGTAAGVAYGLAVCGGLLVTLAVSPHGQELLFPLGPGTVVMAVTGHALFGAVVGARAKTTFVVGRQQPARRAATGGRAAVPVTPRP